VAVLGRSEITLRSHYLRPLVRAGQLEMLHPRTPNHPQQAYRTARTDTSGEDPA
jgi:hypothetical protein